MSETTDHRTSAGTGLTGDIPAEPAAAGHSAAVPAVVQTAEGPRQVFAALFIPATPDKVPAHLVVYGMTGDENPDNDGGDYAVGLLVHHPAGDVITDVEDDLSYREAIGIMFQRAERLL